MIKQELWNEKKKEHIPSFLCPTCNEGFLVPDKNTLIKVNSDRAYELYNYTLDPSDISYTFSIISKCGNVECKEAMAISGTNTLWENGYVSQFDLETEEYNRLAEGEPKYSNNYVIEFTSLPINLIALPENIDEDFKDEILKSFKLFWQDTNSCANKIRIALEILLTNKLKVKQRQRTKDKKKSTQKEPKFYYKNLTLGERIGVIKSDSKYSKYKSIAGHLKALKWIGNDGSHKEARITRQQIQTAYKILENLIAKIYNSDKEVDRLTKSINKRNR